MVVPVHVVSDSRPTIYLLLESFLSLLLNFTNNYYEVLSGVMVSAVAVGAAILLLF